MTYGLVKNFQHMAGLSVLKTLLWTKILNRDDNFAAKETVITFTHKYTLNYTSKWIAYMDTFFVHETK